MLCIGMLIALAWLFLSKMMQMQEVRERVRIGMVLMDPDVPWNDQIRRELELPSRVFTRGEAVKHYLCTLADEDPENLGRNLYFVGRYFLVEDCAQAEHYISLYLERSDFPDEIAKELLERIHRDGCDSSAEWLIHVGG